MNYSAMIQNRRSVHAFREKEVPSEAIGQLRSYYEKTCPRLVPEIATELIVLDKDAQPALDAACRVIPYRWAKQVAFGIFIS